uniref:tumor necrosis factor ligand superfamily member 14-like n=1 Tax=Myxine glutinosa TaxID=7769 RepID=UPI00358E495F
MCPPNKMYDVESCLSDVKQPAADSYKRRCSGCFFAGCCLALLGLFTLALSVYFLLHVPRGARDDPTTAVQEDKERVLEKMQNGKTSHDYISQKRSSVSAVAAHLTGKDMDKDTMIWEDKHGLAFRRGMEYRDGSLYIPQDGVYYVYSQVHFRYSGCENGYIGLDEHNNPIKTVTHSVHCSDKDGSHLEALLMSRHSACQVTANKDGDSGFWSQTSYQGGLFELKKGYRLNVIVSRKELVSPDENKTFFGAFLVSGETF